MALEVVFWPPHACAHTCMHTHITEEGTHESQVQVRLSSHITLSTQEESDPKMLCVFGGVGSV